MMEKMNKDKSENRLIQLIKKNPLVCFFVLACAISWISFVPIILAEWKIIEIADSNLYAAIFSFHTFGPAIAACFILRLTEGKSGWTKIRVAIAGSDTSNFSRIPENGEHVINIQRNSVLSSYIELPMKEIFSSSIKETASR